MPKIKVLILQNEISAYNVALYNAIAKDYELTVGYYSKDKSTIPCTFKKQSFCFLKIAPFFILFGLRRFCKSFDVVCFVPDLHVFSYFILPFLPHKYKLINWSIGFRVSYIHPYIVERKHNLLDWIFKRVINACDASIFYMEKSKEFWKYTDVDMSKVFVAPNTTTVIPIIIEPDKKRHILFVGTLYKGKGLDLLLQAYKEAVDDKKICNELHIIGDGEERQYIELFIKNNHLEDKVILHGAIFDEKLLAQQFSYALLCVSPTQGGLSVPKSMGYGVPFVTRKDAITGGEIYHITSGVNGVIYDNDDDLSNIICEACFNPQKYIKMGIRAKEYYDKNATIDHMAKGAMDAFKFVLKS